MYHSGSSNELCSNDHMTIIRRSYYNTKRVEVGKPSVAVVALPVNSTPAIVNTDSTDSFDKIVYMKFAFPSCIQCLSVLWCPCSSVSSFSRVMRRTFKPFQEAHRHLICPNMKPGVQLRPPADYWPWSRSSQEFGETVVQMGGVQVGPDLVRLLCIESEEGPNRALYKL